MRMTTSVSITVTSPDMLHIFDPLWFLKPRWTQAKVSEMRLDVSRFDKRAGLAQECVRIK